MQSTIQFLVRRKDAFSEPPGLLPLITFKPRGTFDEPPVFGVVPAANGGCEWWYAEWKTSSLWKTVPEDENKEGPAIGRVELQRTWLQFVRKELGWGKVLTVTGKSQRTWEGWEQGRTLPYHQAYFLANHLWAWLALPKNLGNGVPW